MVESRSLVARHAAALVLLTNIARDALRLLNDDPGAPGPSEFIDRIKQARFLGWSPKLGNVG